MKRNIITIAVVAGALSLGARADAGLILDLALPTDEAGFHADAAPAWDSPSAAAADAGFSSGAILAAMGSSAIDHDSVEKLRTQWAWLGDDHDDDDGDHHDGDHQDGHDNDDDGKGHDNDDHGNGHDNDDDGKGHDDDDDGKGHDDDDDGKGHDDDDDNYVPPPPDDDDDQQGPPPQQVSEPGLLGLMGLGLLTLATYRRNRR